MKEREVYAYLIKDLEVMKGLLKNRLTRFQRRKTLIGLKPTGPDRRLVLPKISYLGPEA